MADEPKTPETPQSIRSDIQPPAAPYVPPTRITPEPKHYPVDGAAEVAGPSPYQAGVQKAAERPPIQHTSYPTDSRQPSGPFGAKGDPKAESREAKKAAADEWHLPIEDFPVDGVVVEAEVGDELQLVRHVNGTWEAVPATFPITVVRPTRWRGNRKDRTAADYPNNRKPPVGSPLRDDADKANEANADSTKSDRDKADRSKSEQDKAERDRAERDNAPKSGNVTGTGNVTGGNRIA